MSKVTVALASFIVGACTMFLFLELSGSHTSTFAQAPNEARILVVEGAEPVIPPWRGMTVEDNVFSGVTQQLDGVSCIDCTFDNATLEYAGGAYALIRPKFSGPIRINFKGAAANAINLQAFLASLNTGRTLPPATPRQPIPQIARLTKPITNGDLLSPYGRE
jgi:hypothetical protein